MAETGIFSLISQLHLREVLETLHLFIGMPVRLIDRNGEDLMLFGKTPGYCALLQRALFSSDICFELRRKAGLQAARLGSFYFFTCHANLNHIAYPILHRGTLLGSIIAGPFLLGDPDSTLVGALAEEQHLSPSMGLELYEELSNLPGITTQRANEISRLMTCLIEPLISTDRVLMHQEQEKLSQQSRINETIQRYKAQEPGGGRDVFYEKESRLLSKVRSGNAPEAKDLLNDLLGYAIFSQGSSPDLIRTRAIELTALLSRAAMEGGADAELLSAANARYLSAISREPDTDKLCLLLQQAVEYFIGETFYRMDGGNLSIRRALNYMATHYMKPVTLGEVAREAGLSPNYFSALFRQTVGTGFRSHLCRIRIEESKWLLLSTNYTLADIAAAVGFADQSHFCKVFKQVVGLTPSSFRS